MFEYDSQHISYDIFINYRDNKIYAGVYDETVKSKLLFRNINNLNEFINHLTLFISDKEMQYSTIAEIIAQKIKFRYCEFIKILDFIINKHEELLDVYIKTSLLHEIIDEFQLTDKEFIEIYRRIKCSNDFSNKMSYMSITNIESSED